jgi:hypothetical protein
MVDWQLKEVVAVETDEQLASAKFFPSQTPTSIVEE